MTLFKSLLPTQVNIFIIWLSVRRAINDIDIAKTLALARASLIESEAVDMRRVIEIVRRGLCF